MLERRESHLSCVGVKVVWMGIALVGGNLEKFLWRGVFLEVTLEELLPLVMIWMGAVVI